MNSNSKPNNNSPDHLSGDLPTSNSNYYRQHQSAFSTMKRDRFELLSAYLDGEVTAAERREVEELLLNDPSAQRLHHRLLMLRSGLQTMPVPTQQPVEQTVEAVFQKLDKRPKMALVWGGTAVAAFCIAALSGLFLGREPMMPQIAQSPTQGNFEDLQIALNEPVVEVVNPDAVGITLNEPIIEIPKAPVTP